MLNKEELIQSVYAQNPWLQTHQVPAELKLSFQRPILATLIKKLQNKYILAIVGPRRAGKTTLLYQLISKLLEKGENPQNLVFFSLDNPLFSEENKLIPNLIKTIQSLIASNKNKLYLFLDEIQYIKNWSNWLKSFYDRKERIKFRALVVRRTKIH